MMKPSHNKALREYFKEYYNNNFLRNFRFIFDKPRSFMKDGKEITYNAKNLTSFKYGNHDTSDKKALNFLTTNSSAKYGLLGGEITYYKTLDDFKRGKIETRFCDRLFFDFDIEDNKEVNQLKQQFKQANETLQGKDLNKRYDKLQKKFQDLIFNKDLLFDVYEEAQSLCTYLSKYGLKPYMIASGSKGYHVNIFFDEIQLTNLSQISHALTQSYSDELNLHYIDTNVFDKNKAHKRLQRCQYGIHSKTNLMTKPLPIDCTYDEMLTILKKNKKSVIDFTYDEMISPEGFSNMLLKLDKKISHKNAQRKQELERINKAKHLQMQKKYGKNYKTFNEIDLRDIAISYGIDGKHQGDRMIVSCPFHNDVHPSSVIFKERFYCSTCNMTLNYYDFISKLEGTNDKDKIMQISSKFLR